MGTGCHTKNDETSSQQLDIIHFHDTLLIGMGLLVLFTYLLDDNDEGKTGGYLRARSQNEHELCHVFIIRVQIPYYR
jgi:hypothetical protein